MKKTNLLPFLVIIIFSSSIINNFAETMFKDNFQDPNKWKFISDNVMGGISIGKVQYQSDTAILSGNVSTENNGGFIQIRMSLDKIKLDKAKADDLYLYKLIPIASAAMSLSLIAEYALPARALVKFLTPNPASTQMKRDNKYVK